MWQKVKTLFSKFQQAPEVSFEQINQPIFEEQNEPVIKKLKRQTNQQKDLKFGEKCSPSK